jgi:hypothetical protein
VPEASGWKINQVSFLGLNVTLSMIDPRDGSWYVAIDTGHFGIKLHRSTDQGATFVELAVPTYPSGETIATGDGKPPQPANLKLIWSLAAGHASQPGRLWAGTAPGGLFRSDDHGASWELVRGLWDHPARKEWFGGGLDSPGIHSICVDPRDPKIVRVAVSCAGVWTTYDDGLTWQNTAHGMIAEYMPPERQLDPNIQDPHRMVQCLNAPDHLWVQHHNGVFRSTDSSTSWQPVRDVPPAVFGFAVAVHPHDPQTAWFVPGVKDECRVPVDAKLVVTRTRDGGHTFQVLSHGLPTENCYDIVFRHALAIDATGNQLAFGSTTGGLWWSHDQGDHWTQLPARLPPIHSVEIG